MGKVLFQDPEGLLNKQNQAVKSLEGQLEGGTDVEAEMTTLRVEIENTMMEFDNLKIALGKKIALFFKGFSKKEQSMSMNPYFYSRLN